MTVPDVSELRDGSRRRAADRPQGPALARVEDLRGPDGLPLRRYAPEHPYPAAVEDVAAVLRWARPAAVAGDSAGGYLATMACMRLRDEGDAYARRLAAAGVRVVHRQEPGLVHGFIQNMDLTSPEAAAAHDRLIADAGEAARPPLPAFLGAQGVDEQVEEPAGLLGGVEGRGGQEDPDEHRGDVVGIDVRAQ